MSPRRELRLAVLLCLLGSVVVLLAVSRTWFSYADGQQLTIDAVRTSVRGSRIVSGAQALGYVGLAGVVALAATRHWGRVLVGVLVLASGIGVVVVVGRVLAEGISTRALPAGPAVTGTSTSSVWAWLVILGGLLLVLSGVLVAARGRSWAALSASYQAPAARPVEPPVTDKGAWDAFDRGEDPTS